MGKKKTESSQTSRIGPATAEQTDLQGMLQNYGNNLIGQLDLTGLGALSSGNLSQLTPEMERAIMEAQGAARFEAGDRYAQDTRAVDANAGSRNILGSSLDAVNQAFAKQNYDRTLAGLDSQAAGMRMQLPFQLGQQQLAAGQLLGGLAQGNNLGLLQNYLNQQLGNSTVTGTQETSGFSIGELAALGGAINPGGGGGGEGT